jgi:hypothetical protein
MNEIATKARILMRAEMTLFKADAQRRGNKLLLASLSILCVFVALVFANMGLFFNLTDSAIDSRAAFILAGGNLALAIIPLLLMRQSKPGPEEIMVREIREMAATELSKDVDEIAEQVASVGSSINQLKNGISSFSAGGLSSTLGPGISLAIDLLKKK